MVTPNSVPESDAAPHRAFGAQPTDKDLHWVCDRCGDLMFEDKCKITCRNCGHRFDCSDLNLYFD